MFRRVLRRKPLWIIQSEVESAAKEHRVFGLFSLLAVGISGAVGSGIFVLSGEISKNLAGPATFLAWLIGGIVCSITALSYAELSTLIQTGGSTYSFTYVVLGEIFAIVAFIMLNLEFGIASAAVARSWGDKVAFFAKDLEVAGCSRNETCWLNSLNDTNINVSGATLSLLATLVLLNGAEFGRDTINVLFVLKLGLVLFVIFVGFANFDSSNFDPVFAPHSDHVLGGFQGVFAGTTVAFFGFIGFDEITTLSLQTKDVSRNGPLAVLGTIAAITVLYVFASIALVGMVPYHLIDPQEGFGSAFRYVELDWAVNIVMLGQILVVLPAVVLVSALPQSQLLAAIAGDGLLPGCFAYQNKRGAYVWSVTISGTVITLLALVLPFDNLSELISCGILIAFNLTNTSLLVMRTGNGPRALVLNGFIVPTTCLIGFMLANSAPVLLIAVFAFTLLALLFCLRRYVTDSAQGCFSVPLVPFTPALALTLNWYFFAETSSQGLLQITVLISIVLLFYVSCQAYAVLVGHSSGFGSHRINRNSQEMQRVQVPTLDDGDAWLPHSPSFDGEEMFSGIELNSLATT